MIVLIFANVENVFKTHQDFSLTGVLESRTSAITDPFQPLLQYIDEYMEKFTSDSLSNVSPSMMVDFHASIADRVAAFSKKWLNSQNCA